MRRQRRWLRLLRSTWWRRWWCRATQWRGGCSRTGRWRLVTVVVGRVVGALGTCGGVVVVVVAVAVAAAARSACSLATAWMTTGGRRTSGERERARAGGGGGRVEGLPPPSRRHGARIRFDDGSCTRRPGPGVVGAGGGGGVSVGRPVGHVAAAKRRRCTVRACRWRPCVRASVRSSVRPCAAPPTPDETLALGRYIIRKTIITRPPRSYRVIITIRDESPRRSRAITRKYRVRSRCRHPSPSLLRPSARSLARRCCQPVRARASHPHSPPARSPFASPPLASSGDHDPRCSRSTAASVSVVRFARVIFFSFSVVVTIIIVIVILPILFFIIFDFFGFNKRLTTLGGKAPRIVNVRP